MEKARDWKQKLLSNELLKGVGSDKELQALLEHSPAAWGSSEKVQTIFSSFTKALSILTSSRPEHGNKTDVSSVGLGQAEPNLAEYELQCQSDMDMQSIEDLPCIESPNYIEQSYKLDNLQEAGWLGLTAKSLIGLERFCELDIVQAILEAHQLGIDSPESVDVLTGPSASSKSSLSKNNSSESPFCPSGFKYEELRHVSKKRKQADNQTTVVCASAETGLEVPPVDGFTWRKYGQKNILGRRYPRSYFRCISQHSQGCSATKHVQRSDEDPSILEVTCMGSHTCLSVRQNPFSKPPLQPELEHHRKGLNLSVDSEIPDLHLSMPTSLGASASSSKPLEQSPFDAMMGDLQSSEGITEIYSSAPKKPKLPLMNWVGGILSQNIDFVSAFHSLQVLNLSHSKIENLPESLSNLENLQSLIFHHCERLVTVPSLAKLKELRVLDLSYTSIKELPHGMEKLVNLKRLHLSYTRNLQIFSLGMLHYLPVLEDMFMFGSRCFLSLNSPNVWGGADIEDVISTATLVNLAICFVDLPSFNTYVISGHWQMLKSFRFDIRPVSNNFPLASFKWRFSIQILGCDLIDHKTSLVLPYNTLELVIESCRGITCLSELRCVSCSRELKACAMVDCKGIECILMAEEGMPTTLEELMLYNLPDLKTLFRGAPQIVSLTNLKSITVEDCLSLKNLFSIGWLQCLKVLEYVRLWMCDEMEEIAVEDEGTGDLNVSNTIVLPSLKEIRLGFLPALQRICKNVLICDSLVAIVVQKCPKLKKLPLCVDHLPSSIETIRGSRKWWDTLDWDDINAKSCLETFLNELPEPESDSELESGTEEEEEEEEEENDDDNADEE